MWRELEFDVKQECEYSAGNIVLTLTTCKAVCRVHTLTVGYEEYVVASEAYVDTLKLDGVNPFLRKIVRDVDVLQAEVAAVDKEAG